MPTSARDHPKPLVPDRGLPRIDFFCKATDLGRAQVNGLLDAGLVEGSSRHRAMVRLVGRRLFTREDLAGWGLVVTPGYDPELLRSHPGYDDQIYDDESNDDEGGAGALSRWTMCWWGTCPTSCPVRTVAQSWVERMDHVSERDLEAQVQAATAALGDWVETLAERLETRFECEVREATPGELQRTAYGDHVLTAPSVGSSFAVQPRSPEAATLVVVSHDFFTGTGVTFKFGEVGSEVIPCCDECAVLPPSDSPNDDLVEQADSAVWAATQGFAEFRWENQRATEPEMAFEEGWFYDGVGSSWSPASPGPTFQHVWRPWQPRRPRRP